MQREYRFKLYFKGVLIKEFNKVLLTTKEILIIVKQAVKDYIKKTSANIKDILVNVIPIQDYDYQIDINLADDYN